MQFRNCVYDLETPESDYQDKTDSVHSEITVS
jgi:hypothetical protein